jgi:hypothetical protein
VQGQTFCRIRPLAHSTKRCRTAFRNCCTTLSLILRGTPGVVILGSPLPWVRLPATPSRPMCLSSAQSCASAPNGARCIRVRWPLPDNGAIAAGIAAYRAIHVSGFAVGSFPFNASLQVGKLQQTSPGVTVGFPAGSLLLDTQMRLYPVSLESIYTFVWWVPVTCCKDYDEIMGMCTPKSATECFWHISICLEWSL